MTKVQTRPPWDFHNEWERMDALGAAEEKAEKVLLCDKQL